MKFANMFLIALLSIVCSGQTHRVAEPDAPSKITVAPKEEPGERLIVSGKVFEPDGKSPLKGASVYVYHTDIKGYYSENTTSNSNPRLRGWMRTDVDGRYEFNTIKPGPYPDARVPAHIHYVVSAPGYKERIFEIVFEGDPFISERMKLDAKNEYPIFSIRPTERGADSVLRCVQDIKLQRQ